MWQNSILVRVVSFSLLCLTLFAIKGHVLKKSQHIDKISMDFIIYGKIKHMGNITKKYCWYSVYQLFAFSAVKKAQL